MSISAADVKTLRTRTGAGIMDCKRALAETKGDVEKAIDFLRKQGAAIAEKKGGRATNDGIIECYIHPGSRLGVMIEVNCETDFVAKTDDFKSLVKDLAMQVAAANPVAVDREQFPAEILEKEKEIYKTQALNEGKPEHILDRFIEGKLGKYFQENCLLDQNFVKDPNKTISQLITETIAKIGENISVKRFVRFQLGEE